MKKHLYLLMLTLLVVTMSELQVAGMLPEMARDLNVPTAQIGILISVYALGMALGGPMIALGLRHSPPKRALLLIVVTYAVLEALAPVVHEYWWLALIRFLTGCLSGAVFGLTLTFAARLAPSPDKIGSSISITLSGLMVGTVLGLPVSHAISTYWGWQASFYVLGVIALIVAVIDLRGLPALDAVSQEMSTEDIRQLRSPKLWTRYLVSFLTIGATFGAFSYFTPLLEQEAGFTSTATTIILLVYGLCTVIGNLLVGKFADRHAVALLRIGHTSVFAALVLLALFANFQLIALPMVLIVGFFGVTMNPALVARVVEVAGAGALVNTVHTSAITLGVVAGTAVGAAAISLSGGNPVGAMWTGAALAVAAAMVLATQTLMKNKPATRGSGARSSGAL